MSHHLPSQPVLVDTCNYCKEWIYQYEDQQDKWYHLYSNASVCKDLEPVATPLDPNTRAQAPTGVIRLNTCTNCNETIYLSARRDEKAETRHLKDATLWCSRTAATWPEEEEQTTNSDPAVAEARAAWVDAMKSDGYVQGTNHLRVFANTDDSEEISSPKFCCLGVACDVFGKGGWIQSSYVENAVTYSGITIPPGVMKILGLTKKDCEIMAAVNDRATSYEPSINYIENRLS